MVFDFWDVPVDCIPLWSVYTRLEAAAAVRRSLDEIEGEQDWVVHPHYHVVPRIRSTTPNMGHLCYFERLLFAPRPNRVFLVGRLEDLELRCFAATDNRLFGVRSDVCSALVAGNDPAEEELGLLLGGRGRPRVTGWFRSLSRAHQIELVRLLLFAEPRGLSTHQIAELLSVHSTLSVPVGELTALRKELFTQPDPHFDNFVNAHLPDIPQVHKTSFWRRCYLFRRATPATPRRIQEDPQRVEDFQTTRAVSITGRIGRPVSRAESLIVAYLELADEVRKVAAYRLVRAGFPLVAVSGDELVLELDESAEDEQGVAEAVQGAVASLRGDQLAQNCWRHRRAQRWRPAGCAWR